MYHWLLGMFSQLPGGEVRSYSKLCRQGKLTMDCHTLPLALPQALPGLFCKRSLSHQQVQ